MPDQRMQFSDSWMTLANLALGRLGNATVSSLSEGTQAAENCMRFLPDAIEYVLSQYDWPCARVRMRLTPIEEKPAFGWKYQYPLPAGYMRLLEVHGDMGTETRYATENGMILSDSPEISILCIATPENAASLTQGVRRAIYLSLAFLLVPPLASDEALANRIAGERTEAVERAKIEAAQSEYDPNQSIPWYSERREGRE
jgi:hypothetical protein